MPMSPQPAQYRYFVSFFVAPGGFGNVEIPVSNPIRGISDVKAISELISRNNGGAGVTVLYFAPLPAQPTPTTTSRKTEGKR